MNYNCPKNQTCDKIRCCKHKQTEHDDKPVHSACDWYLRYIKMMIRKEKLKNLNENC